MNTFAAEPGTTLLLAALYLGELEVREYPVVGWTHVQGKLCFPLVTVNPVSSPSVAMVEAIEFASGRVTEAASQAVFPDRESWSMAAFKHLRDVEKGQEDREKALSEKRVTPMVFAPGAEEAERAEGEAAMAALKKSGAIEPVNEEEAPAEPVQAVAAPAKATRTRKPKAPAPAPAQDEDDDIAGML